MKIPCLTVLVVVLLPFILAGCGIYALPSLTDKTVKPSDITGTWHYKMDYDETTITLLLNKDGSFIQKIPVSKLGKAETCKGKWTLDGPYVALDKAMQYDSYDDKPKRKIASYSIWVIDKIGWGGKFRLFGGDGFQGDPDSGDVFERIE